MEWPKYKRVGGDRLIPYPELILYAMDCIRQGDGFYHSTKSVFSSPYLPLRGEDAPFRITITRRIHDGCHQNIDETEIWEKVMEVKDRQRIEIVLPLKDGKSVVVKLTDEQMDYIEKAGYRIP